MIQRLDPDTVATAAAAGDSTMLREFLARRPSEVHLYYIMWELSHLHQNSSLQKY